MSVVNNRRATTGPLVVDPEKLERFAPLRARLAERMRRATDGASTGTDGIPRC